MKVFALTREEFMLMQAYEVLEANITDMLISAAVSKASLIGNLGYAVDHADKVIADCWEKTSKAVEESEEMGVANDFFDGKISYDEFKRRLGAKVK